jgi:ABC-type sugar transport system substrate-binding protein
MVHLLMQTRGIMYGRRRIHLLASLLVLMVGMLLATSAGCERAAPRADVEYTFALIGSNPDHPAWPIVQAGARRFATDHPSMHIIFEAPQRDTPAAQQAVIGRVRQQRLDAMAIWPVSGASLVGVIDDLVGRGVPVVTVGVDAVDSRRVGFVGWDQRRVGESLADLAGRQIRRGRTLMVLHADERSEHLAMRWQALQSAMSAQTRLKALMELDCQGSPAAARQWIAERMQRYPDLSGWISLEDWPLRGMDEPESLLPAGCVMITCHPGPAYWPLVAESEAGFVATDYFQWGWRAMWIAYNVVRNVPLEAPDYYTPIEQITADNLPAWQQRWREWLGTVPTATATRNADPVE